MQKRVGRWVNFFCIIGLLSISMGAVAQAQDGPARSHCFTGPFATFELHAALFSDAAEFSILAGSFGYGARGGYRWNNWGLLLLVEHNLWVATEYDTEVVRGAVNIGVGGEFIYADGFVRTSLAVGPSILAYDTLLDEAGSTGLFLDIRPVGLRWPVHNHLIIGLDPLNFTVVAPVLTEIPLVHIQYRTTGYLEFVF